MKHELLAAVAFLEDVAAGDVRREQVRRELDAAEVERQEARECLDELRLAQSRKAFEEHVTAGEQGGDDLVDRLLLAENDLPQLADEPRDLRLAVGHAVGSKENSRVSSHGWLTSRSISSRHSDVAAPACGAKPSDRRRRHTSSPPTGSSVREIPGARQAA
jgi:hypothetical protein